MRVKERFYPALIIFSLGIFVLAACNQVRRDDKPVAKVGDQFIYASEIDFVLMTMPPQQKAMMGEEQARIKIFDQLLERRIQAVTAQKMVDDQGKVAEGMESMRKRDLSRFYQQKFVMEGLTYPEKKLRAWYENHQSDYLKPDSSVADFEEVRSQVAQGYMADQDPAKIKKFYEENSKRYEEKPQVDLSVIQTESEAEAKRIKALLAQGQPFDSLAKALSTDKISAPKGGRIGWIKQGQWRREISRIPEINSVLFDPAKGLKKGEVSDVLSFTVPGKDTKTVYTLLKVEDSKEATIPAFEEVKKQVMGDFFKGYQQTLLKEINDSLRKAYEVEFSELPKPDAKSYYEKNKEKYKTQQAWELYHIEATDSATLATMVAGAKDLAAFQKLAEQSTNEVTKAQQGKIGVVKLNHALPWGIGMMPTLFRELKDQKAGFISSVIKAPDTDKYQVFYVNQVIAPQIKPFDRVKKSIEVTLSNEKDVALPPETVLVTMGGKPLFTQADVDTLRMEIPPNQQARFNREALLNFLVDWEVQSMEAEKMGIDQLPAAIALQRLRKADLWGLLFRDSIMNRHMGVPVSKLETIYSENQDVFNGPFDKVMREVALFHIIPDSAYQKEYTDNKAKYPDSAGTSEWTDHKKAIFNSLRRTWLPKVNEERMDYFREMVGVEILDSSLVQQPKSAEEMLKEAKELFGKRNFAQARQVYEDIRKLHPGNKEMAPEVAMGLGQVLMEEKKFDRAASEFKGVYTVFPKYKDAYKAMFMEGFIYYEHIKDDAKAQKVLEEMLKKYPGTDLSDDAEALVNDLKSGRTLMQKILEKAAAQSEKTMKEMESKQDSEKSSQ